MNDELTEIAKKLLGDWLDSDLLELVTESAEAMGLLDEEIGMVALQMETLREDLIENAWRYLELTK